MARRRTAVATSRAGFASVAALALGLAAARLLGMPGPERAAPTEQAQRVVALVNGRWLLDGRFVTGTRFIVNGRLQERTTVLADTTIDLAGGFVVPPFGEAHNHNIEPSRRLPEVMTQYLRRGVFHVANPSLLPRLRASLEGVVNVPTGVDATFALGGITGPGGHPVGVVQRNVSRGSWSVSDGDGAFHHEVADATALARVWPALVAQRPDFIKVYLLYADEYAARLRDSSTIGWRGLDPTLLPEVVQRAHASSLRVVAHVETAADFRTAIRAGVDMIGHMPGFRGDERTRLPSAAPYLLTAADARDVARRGTIVVTTLGGAAEFDRAGPDSLTRRALDDLHRRNLRTLRAARVRLAIGSDSYGDDSWDEVRYLRSLGVFTDAELLKLWSQDTPRAIHPTRAVGSLTAGSEASFLVLACNALEQLECTGRIRLRFKDGRLLHPE
jgi:hypothetical protein